MMHGESQESQDGLAGLISRNVEAIAQIEKAAHAERTQADIVSDAIAGFCGRPLFVYVHIIWFGLWLGINTLPFIPSSWRFDKPPFSELTLIVSLEAIFLSAFILISQNRQQKIADHRNHLDLQINLLAEQESSQMLVMLKQVMDHLGIEADTKVDVLDQETDTTQLAAKIKETMETLVCDDPTRP